MSIRKRLKDPFDMNGVDAQTHHYETPVMPHEATTRVIYTSEVARRNAENRNAAKLSGGRTYKPKG